MIYARRSDTLPGGAVRWDLSDPYNTEGTEVRAIITQVAGLLGHTLVYGVQANGVPKLITHYTTTDPAEALIRHGFVVQHSLYEGVNP